MSRIAKAPILLPAGVEMNIDAGRVNVRGPKGVLSLQLADSITLDQEGREVTVRAESDSRTALAGTFRSLVNSMVGGVTSGFEKRLTLVGVGYRAQIQGRTLTLTLGYSHPIEYQAPEGITIEAPSQTEIVVKGCDRQKVGQVAAEIRGFRPPEPYKGKGVRYSNEHVARKEAKKA